MPGAAGAATSGVAGGGLMAGAGVPSATGGCVVTGRAGGDAGVEGGTAFATGAVATGGSAFAGPVCGDSAGDEPTGAAGFGMP